MTADERDLIATEIMGWCSPWWKSAWFMSQEGVVMVSDSRGWNPLENDFDCAELRAKIAEKHHYTMQSPITDGSEYLFSVTGVDMEERIDGLGHNEREATVNCAVKVAQAKKDGRA